MGPTTLPNWIWLIYILFIAINIVSMWKIFIKANQPGWTSIVPIYNIFIFLKIVNRPTWWIILFFIPFVNGIMGIVIIYDLVKVFGKKLGFLFGVIFLPFIFYPILAFGDAKYMFNRKEENINFDLKESNQEPVQTETSQNNSIDSTKNNSN